MTRFKVNYTRADVTSARLDASGLASGRTHLTASSALDCQAATGKVGSSRVQKSRAVRISSRVCRTETSDTGSLTIRALPAMQTATESKADTLLTGRQVCLRNPYTPDLRNDSRETGRRDLSGKSQVDLKAHFSDMAHISMARVQSEVGVFEKERRKLSEFFLQPTKQMLMRDSTSAIHMEEYMRSMDKIGRAHV